MVYVVNNYVRSPQEHLQIQWFAREVTGNQYNYLMSIIDYWKKDKKLANFGYKVNRWGKHMEKCSEEVSFKLLVVELYQTHNFSSNELWSHVQNIIYRGSSLQAHHQGFDFRGWACNHPLTQGKIGMENKSLCFYEEFRHGERHVLVLGMVRNRSP